MNKKKILEFEADNSTAFGFTSLDYIEDFELIENIIKEEEKVKVTEKLAGPSSLITIFDLNGLMFKLVYNSDIGNALILINPNSKAKIELKKIAKKAYTSYAKKYPENLS